MKKMNKTETLLLLAKLGIQPKKRLGQNFLINENVTKNLIQKANLNNSDIVLEIGPGLGALTEEIVKIAKNVYAYEIDSILFQYLQEQYGLYSNLKLFNSDILKAELPYYNKVVANIPYTITGPLFEKVFYINNPPKGTLIIEKTIADRIFKPKNYKTFSRISIMFNTFMEPIEQCTISSSAFYPEPKIKLSLIQVEPKKEIDPFLLEQDTKMFFFKLIQGIMPYKNKNLVNALTLCFENTLYIKTPKQRILQLLNKQGIRDEKFAFFDIEDFLNLSKIIWKYITGLNQG
jgi:16S rRNA (adenine1518-N6/adenine1519-N6)-dimethyltransferase